MNFICSIFIYFGGPGEIRTLVLQTLNKIIIHAFQFYVKKSETFRLFSFLLMFLK
nr:MAG TPA: hypothetical protein [Bacteriophage sp.]